MSGAANDWRVSARVRLVCGFAIGGVGSAEDVDAGLTLGLSHPRGPMEWGEAIGVAAG